MINTNIAIDALAQTLKAQSNLADKISSPDKVANLEDIVRFKSAGAQSESGVAVLKQVLDTKRAVDILA